MEEEEGEFEDGVLDKGTGDRVWKRSNLVHSKSGAWPGTPFSWATCDETKVAALLRSRDQGDGRGRRRPEKGSRNQRVMKIRVLLLATVLLSAIF